MDACKDGGMIVFFIIKWVLAWLIMDEDGWVGSKAKDKRASTRERGDGTAW